MNNDNKFFALSGMEGTGKSTIIKRLISNIDNSISIQDPCTYFREFLCSSKYNPDKFTEALTYLASRSYTYNKTISPALTEGKIVFADRWSAETFVYQHFAQNSISLELLNSINNEMLTINPIITFILLATPETSLSRSNDKLSKIDIDEGKFERKGVLFHHLIRDGFIEYSKINNKTFVINTENKTIDNVYYIIYDLVSRIIYN